MEQPECMVRVKLPSSSGYAACPSGDTEYEMDRTKALRDALPEGYEYVYPRTGQYWAKDSEGYTWARLKCTDEKNALEAARDTIKSLRTRLKRIEKAVG